MKGYLTQLILSMSLAGVVYTAPSSQSAHAFRNKRSFFADQVHRHYLTNPKMWSRNMKMGEMKRGGLDTLDFDSILNDPFFMELNEENDRQQHGNEMMTPVDNMRPGKDEMSNVIPGAQGPYYDEPLRKQEQEMADTMMDDFLLFLTMKDMGMLDACLGFKRR